MSELFPSQLHNQWRYNCTVSLTEDAEIDIYHLITDDDVAPRWKAELNDQTNDAIETVTRRTKLGCLVWADKVRRRYTNG